LQIWEMQIKAPLITPGKKSQIPGQFWTVRGENIYFQRYGAIDRKEKQALTAFRFATYKRKDLRESTPCMVLVLVNDAATAARVVAQDQNGNLMLEVAGTSSHLFEQLFINGVSSYAQYEHQAYCRWKWSGHCVRRRYSLQRIERSYCKGSSYILNAKRYTTQRWPTEREAECVQTRWCYAPFSRPRQITSVFVHFAAQTMTISKGSWS